MDPFVAFLIGLVGGFALGESGALVRVFEWLGLVPAGYPGSDDDPSPPQERE